MQGGVAIDLSKLKTIKIDKKAATVTIGPGVLFGDIFDPLYNAGFQIRKSRTNYASTHLSCTLI